LQVHISKRHVCAVEKARRVVDITKNFLAALRSLFKWRFELQAEILVLRHQLNELRRSASSRPHLRNWDRLLLVWLYRL
jgi:hypothetical protein